MTKTVSVSKSGTGFGQAQCITHFPMDPICDICLRTTITRASCRKRLGTVVPRAENFGDLATADQKVLSEESESRNNHRYAVVVQDLATQWSQSFQCKTKTSQETQKSLQKFLEPYGKPKVIYTDNSLEFGKAGEDLQHLTVQRKNVLLRERYGESRKGLLQSGLDEKWWTDSMECYCHLRNIQDLMS